VPGPFGEDAAADDGQPSIENRTSIPVTAWAEPPGPRAALYSGRSAVIKTRGIPMRLSTGPGSRASETTLWRIKMALSMRHRQGPE